MRRIVVCVVALVLVGATGFAASSTARRGLDVPELPWVEFVSGEDVELAKDAAAAKLASGTHNRPAVLLETNHPTYPYVDEGSGSQVTAPILLLSIDANGYAEPVTLWLWWQNRKTGERRYLANGAILDEGVVQDMFGTAGAPVWTPTLKDFKFFGLNGAWGPGPVSPTGLYMFGFEVRDVTGDQVIARSYALYGHVSQTVLVTADITTDTLWTSDKAYLLIKGGASFPVYVGPRDGGGAPVTLTIEPGTVIYGDKAAFGTLAVQRGHKIVANGTPLMPIIFTSPFLAGARKSGDWGGLVLNGYAPVGSDTGQLEGEGSSGKYGGTNPIDSSGVLSYVRVEFAGVRFTEEDELNGIALQGVGSGTVINRVQVNRNADDGIEFFGGTASAQYVLVTGCEDDSFDWTYGWTGNVSNVVVWQGLVVADHGIEADNDQNVPDRQPRSNPRIFNATFVGNKELAGGKGRAALVRRGTAGLIRNAIFTGFPNYGIAMTEAATYTQAQQGNLRITSSIIYGNGNVGQGSGGVATADVLAWLQDPEARNQFVDPLLGDAFNHLVPDLLPLAGSPALDAHHASPTSAYIGGMAPGDPWIYEPWTSFAAD